MAEQAFAQFVDALVNATNAERTNECNAYISSVIRDSPAQAIDMATTIVLQDGYPLYVVQQCLAIVKHIFTPKPTNPLNIIKGNWKGIPGEAKGKIKTALMRGLYFPNPSIRSFAAIGWTLILQLEQKPQVFEVLTKLVEVLVDKEQFNIDCKFGALQALREFVVHELIDQSYDLGEIRPIVMQFLIGLIESMAPGNEEELCNLVEMMNIFNCLFELFGGVFEGYGDREALINIMRGKLSIMDKRIHQMVYDIFYSMVVHFYPDSSDQANPSLRLIFETSVASFGIPNYEFVEPAIDFWRKIAKYELCLLHKPGSFKSEPPTYIGISEVSAEPLIGLLIQCLQRPCIDEPTLDPFDDVNIAVVAARCLRTLSKLLPELTFRMVTEASAALLAGEAWEERYGGILSLWCVAKTSNPEARRLLCDDILAKVLPFTNDVSSMVAFQTLNFVQLMLRMNKCLSYNPAAVNAILSTVFGIASDNLCIRVGVMWVIKEYAIACGEDPANSTLKNHSDVPLYNNVMEVLMARLEEAEASPSVYISHVFDAMVEVITNVVLTSPEEAARLETLLQYFLQKTEQYLAMPKTQENGPMIHRNIDVCCTVVSALISKLEAPILNAAVGRILPALNGCIGLMDPVIFNNSLIALAKLLEKCYGSAGGFADNMMEYLRMGFISGNPRSTAVTASCVYTLLEECETFMNAHIPELLGRCMELLAGESVPLRTKTHLIYAVGKIIDKSPAIPPLGEIMTMLNSLSGTKLNIKQNWGDREVAPGWFASLLFAYQAILRKSDAAGFREAFCERANYRVIHSLFDAIGNNTDILNEKLAKQIVNYLYDILSEVSEGAYGKKLIPFMTRKVIEFILGAIESTFGYQRVEWVRKKINDLR